MPNIDLLTESNAKCEMENMLRVGNILLTVLYFIPGYFSTFPPMFLVVIYTRYFEILKAEY